MPKIRVEGISAAAPYYTAAAYAAAQYRSFVEATVKMHDEALKLDPAAEEQFAELVKALDLLRPIFE